MKATGVSIRVHDIEDESRFYNFLIIDTELIITNEEDKVKLRYELNTLYEKIHAFIGSWLL